MTTETTPGQNGSERCMISHQGLVPGRLYAYVDGSTYRTNPGPMSWAVLYVRDDTIVEEGGEQRIWVGAAQVGTNSEAELLAVIWALERETHEDLVVVSDSEVTLRCAIGQCRPRAHKGLWERFGTALAFRQRRGLETQFEYVRGHSQHAFNCQAHQHARALARENAALVTQTGLG